MPKLLHIADLHLDSPFSSVPEGAAEVLRRERRDFMRSLPNLVRRTGAEIVLLAGDMFDTADPSRGARDCFRAGVAGCTVPVFIVPGNHDYYCPTSPYAEDFGENVHIFRSTDIERVELPKLCTAVYGAGFDTRYIDGSLLAGFTAPEDGLVHIMLLHGEIAASGLYDPISEDDIAASGLDYLALGHIHAHGGFKHLGKTFCAWPGCPIGRGFDETGDRGVILCDVKSGGGRFVWLPTARHRFIISEQDITGGFNPSETEAGENDILRLILRGEGEYGDLTEIGKKFLAFELLDETRPRTDFDAIAKENTLRGLFVSRMLKRIRESEGEERITSERALRLGLDALERREEGS